MAASQQYMPWHIGSQGGSLLVAAVCVCFSGRPLEGGAVRGAQDTGGVEPAGLSHAALKALWALKAAGGN